MFEPTRVVHGFTPLLDVNVVHLGPTQSLPTTIGCPRKNVGSLPQMSVASSTRLQFAEAAVRVCVHPHVDCNRRLARLRII